MKSAIPEILESETEDPKYFMAIRYCGGWGYKKHCLQIQSEIESDLQLQGLFEYQLFKDQCKTGNFDVYLHTEGDRSDEGELIHSKLVSKTFPTEDFNTFK